MKISLLELRYIVRNALQEASDPRKKIGKLVKYVDRPFRVRDVFVRPSPYGGGHVETFYVGVFEDDDSGNIFYAPVEKTGRAPPMRAKKPADFSERDFTEQDVEHFLKAANPEDNRPNIYHVREKWDQISKELSWMEKYIFDHKWLQTPMAKTNEQIAQEMSTKLPIVRAAETRAFHKIEKIIMRDDEVNHDLKIIKIARQMHATEQPMPKIILFLQSELKNKDWMNQLDFLKV